MRAGGEGQSERVDADLGRQPSIDEDLDVAGIRCGGTGPRRREVEVRDDEDDRDRASVSNHRVVGWRHDRQRGRRRSIGGRCGDPGHEEQTDRRQEDREGSGVHVPVSRDYNSSFGAIDVRAADFRRRRIRMIKTNTSRNRTPPLRTSGKVADVDAVTWKGLDAEASGARGVSSLFTSRIVRTWSPSGNETRKPGST